MRERIRNKKCGRKRLIAAIVNVHLWLFDRFNFLLYFVCILPPSFRLSLTLSSFHHIGELFFPQRKEEEGEKKTKKMKGLIR